MTDAIRTPNTVLILRTCHAGFKAHGGFQWPNQVGATVRPSRWNPSNVCGDGLHGFLKAEGCGDLADWSADAEWLVIEAEASSVVVLDNGAKVKVPECTIAHVGRGDSAAAKRIDCLVFMALRGQLGEAPIGRVAQNMGDRSTLTGGYRSTLTGGDRSTLTGGDGSTLTGGDGSTLTGGDRSTLTGGYRSTLTGGDRSTLLFKWWDSRGIYRRKMFTVGDDDCVSAGVKYQMSAAGVLTRVE
jgi:hypothetical protein